MDLRKIDSEWFTIAADIFINLAGAWYAAALIVPTVSARGFPEDLVLLLFNLIFGTICAIGAFLIKKLFLS